MKKIIVAVCFAQVLFAFGLEQAGTVLLNLDASTLSLADGAGVLSWNGGSTLGDFEAVNASTPPTRQTRSGIPVVRFNGAGTVLRCPVATPNSILGANDYSIELWVCSSTPTGTHTMFATTAREGLSNNNGTVCEMRYSTDVKNAVEYYGSGNLTWYGNAGVNAPTGVTYPTAGEWHYLVNTVDGTNTCLYVDGRRVSSVWQTLKLSSDTAFCTVGGVYSRSSKSYTNGFVGDIAKVRVHDGCLTAAQVLANFEEENAVFQRDVTTLAPYWKDGAWRGQAFTGNQTLDVAGATPLVLDGVTTTVNGVQADNGFLTVKNGTLTFSNVLTYNAFGYGAGHEGGLTVGEGGTISATTSLAFGPRPGGSGRLVVAAGGTVNSTAWLRFGDYFGNGTLQIDHGGVATALVVILGPNGGTGAGTVAGSLTTTGMFYLGERGGSATLDIQEGGVVTVQGVVPYDAPSANLSVLKLSGGTICITSGSIKNLARVEVDGLGSVGVPNGVTARIESPIQVTSAEGQTGPAEFHKTGAGTLVVLNELAGATKVFVDEGTLYLKNPLAADQTLHVAAGAHFQVCSPSDIEKITWEETPAEKAVFQVNFDITTDLDLVSLNTLYYDTQLMGPAAGAATLTGVVTSGAISPENPFLVTTLAGTTFNLANTGLGNVPLCVAGKGTAHFTDGRAVSLDPVSTALFVEPGATASFASLDVTGTGETAATLAVTSGTVKVTGTTYVGKSGDAGTLVVSNATMNLANVILAGDVGTARRVTTGSIALQDGAKVTGNTFTFTPYGPIDGADRDTVRATVSLGEGTSLEVAQFIKNDDPAGQMVFEGGRVSATGSGKTLLSLNQNGKMDFIASAGHDIIFDFPANANTFMSGDGVTARFMGEGGFARTGVGSLTFGLGKLTTLEYAGDTCFTGGTTTFSTDVTFPTGSNAGDVRAEYPASLDLNGHTVVFNTAYDNGALVNTSATKATVVVGRGDGDAELGFAPIANATIRKEGSGTLTMNGSLDGDFVLSGAAVCRAPTYRHYRFVVLRACGSNCNSMEFAELKLMDGDEDVTGKRSGFSSTQAGNADSNSPTAEQPKYALDGSLSTKYLDFRCAATKAAANKGLIRLQIDYAQPQRVTSYNWATSNMGAGTKDSRDPTDWLLQGSNDGETWVTLDKRLNFTAPTARWSWAGPFDIPSANTPVNVWGAPGSSLTMDGMPLKAAGVNVETLALTNGGELRLTDGFVNASVTGSGAIVKSGTGEAALMGTPNFAGDLRVAGGRLTVAPFPSNGWKWFRMSFQKTESGEIMETSELSLFDAAGNRVNQGLQMMSDGTAATSLRSGTFAQAKGYAHGTGETVDKLFDGNPQTKWCVTDHKLNTPDTVSSWIIVTMRLADTAAPVTGYLLTSTIHAVNFWQRNPNTWKLEASADGVNWVTVDTRANVAAPHTATTAFNGGVPYSLVPLASPASDEAGVLGTVDVAAEATLAVSTPQFKATGVKVDWTSAGTVTLLATQAGGVLEVVNAPEDLGSHFTLPLVVENASGSFKNWKVIVNGEERPGLAITVHNKRLRVDSSGTAVILR